MSRSNRVVLVTGATSGLGLALAETLVERGCHVLVHGKDERRVASVAAEVGGDPLVADFTSLAAVRRLADEVRNGYDRLDVLINNAGIGAGTPPFNRRELGADGAELRFTVNYLAPVLLTRSLLSLLAASAPARVVNVGSVGQAPVDLTDLDMSRHYSGAEAYFRSKFALAAFTVDLDDELRRAGVAGVTVNCLHPATFMDTKQVREAGYEPWVPVSAGVEPVLNLALGPAGEQSGQYFDGTRTARAHADVYDARLRARLRTATDQLLARFTVVS